MMSKTNLPLFALILAPFLAVSQDFKELIKKGDELYDNGKFKKSAETYTAAFELNEGSALQYYNAACSWALSGDTIESIKYAQLSADNGWKNIDHIKKDKDLSSLHNVKGWENILQKVQANVDEYEKDFDKALMNQLEMIYIKDQTLRQLLSNVEEKFGRDSKELDYYWSLISEQDSLNEVAVINIIEKHGWVGKSKVGGKANMALWLVVQHAPLEMQEKYLPLMKTSVLEGESSGNHLALLEDRIQMRNDKPQTYGSQVIMDKDTGKYKVYDIQNPEFVNERRSEVGLGPIEDYLKRWKIDWVVKQQTSK